MGVRVRTYRRGLRCCLFRMIGNARALRSGTATVQSRFFVYLISYGALIIESQQTTNNGKINYGHFYFWRI